LCVPTLTPVDPMAALRDTLATLRDTPEFKAYATLRDEERRLAKEIRVCYPPLRYVHGKVVDRIPLPGMEWQLKHAQANYQVVEAQLPASKAAIKALPAFQALCAEKKWSPSWGFLKVADVIDATLP